MAKKKPDKLDEIIADPTKDATAEEILSDAGVHKALKKLLVETALEAELTDHLGYENHSPDGHRTGNSRNGKTRKRAIDADGEMEIDVPRDRNGAEGMNAKIQGEAFAPRQQGGGWYARR